MRSYSQSAWTLMERLQVTATLNARLKFETPDLKVDVVQ